ncbi:hypothetical protein EON83_27290 [bacterium]|nr:MAG: hypothetical protein EON83_27290 [bacterium]
MESEDVRAKYEWEARRVAAAFGMEDYQKLPQYQGVYFVFCGGVEVWWNIDWISSDSTATISNVTIGADKDPGCQITDFGFGWEFFQFQNSPPHYRGMMAKALYCLGIENETVLHKLNAPLTLHEKLELRLSLPREFWPQKWFDEDGEWSGIK